MLNMVYILFITLSFLCSCRRSDTRSRYYAQLLLNKIGGSSRAQSGILYLSKANSTQFTFICKGFKLNFKYINLVFWFV